jgi:UDP-N-acetylmuramoyl-tripeptide--D-alanyl-D-alanine ligase
MSLFEFTIFGQHEQQSIVDEELKSTIIDDTYNSSPVAMDEAIGVLREIKSKRKIAVLGDMLELGKFTQEEHFNVGQKIFDVVDILVVVGHRSKFIKEGALEKGFLEKNIYHFNDSRAVSIFLEEIVKKGDLILIKGSQGVRLERAVEAIMKHKELKGTLLCRQDKEWQNR